MTGGAKYEQPATGQSNSHSGGQQWFVWSVNIVVGTNASKTFETQILEQTPVNKLVLLVESKNKNNIEQKNRTQGEISWGEVCIAQNLYEWTL